ncbi:hypothetical protein FNF31_00028 [Cafeteria roenbergensis]|uniref:USP domain-containing protein n=1 Tax=Cafeteria roenbergensis TaxID=33653 RepID=A0A5A8DWA5_CAFRO|nr:hypothetical protein FNF31_00028 [Cafeteria roenbergensis]
MANPALATAPAKAGARWAVPCGAVEEALMRVLAMQGIRCSVAVCEPGAPGAIALGASAVRWTTTATAAATAATAAASKAKPKAKSDAAAAALTAAEVDECAARMAAVRATAYAVWAGERRRLHEEAAAAKAAALVAAEAAEPRDRASSMATAAAVKVPSLPPPPPHLGPYFGTGAASRHVLAAVYAAATAGGGAGGSAQSPTATPSLATDAPAATAALEAALSAATAAAARRPSDPRQAKEAEEAQLAAARAFALGGLQAFLAKCLRCRPAEDATAPLIALLATRVAAWVGGVVADPASALSPLASPPEQAAAPPSPVPVPLLDVLGLALGADSASRAIYDRFGKMPTDAGVLDGVKLSASAVPAPGAEFDGALLGFALADAAPLPGVPEPLPGHHRPVMPQASPATDIARLPSKTYAALSSSQPSGFLVGAFNAFHAAGGTAGATALLGAALVARPSRSPRLGDSQAAPAAVSAAEQEFTTVSSSHGRRGKGRAGAGPAAGAGAGGGGGGGGGGFSYASAAAAAPQATSLFDPVSQRPGEVPGHTGAGPLRFDRGWEYVDASPALPQEAALALVRAVGGIRATPRMWAPRFGEEDAPPLLRAVFARAARPSAEDLAALAAGDRDRLIKLADDAAALARVVTDSKRFAPLVAGSSAGHTADRVRDGVVLAMAMACLHSANATLKEAPPAGAVAPGAAVAGAAAGAVGAPGAAPLGEALAAAGATLLSDVVAAVHRGDGLVPAAGFIGPAARSASSSSSGSGAWTGQASVGRTTINPMFAGTRPAPRSAFAAASAALDDDEVEGGSAGGSAAAGPTKSSAAQAREDAAEPQDVAELRVAWPRRRLPMRWATPRWLAGHFVAEGVPGLLAQLTPPAGAASPPAWVRLSTRLLALGAETLAFAARYGAESLDDVAAQLGAAALAGTDSAAEPAAAAAWQAAAAAAFAGLCRNVGIEVLWGFWERVEAVEPASLSPAAVKLLAELTVVSADRIRARDRVPPFESRFGHGDDAKGSAGLNPQLQYHFGAHVLFELCSGAGAAASAEASGLARRLLPRVLNSTHCRIWLPGFVERAVTGLVDAAGAGGSGGGGSSAAGAGAAIETAKRLLAALPATSLGGGASQEKTLASLSAKLGGGGALAGLLLDELEDHRREALAALGLLADPEDQAAVAAAYAAEDAYASSAATSSAAAAAAAAAAQRAAAGPGDDAGAEDAAKDEAPARWAVDGAALLRAAPSGDAGALRYGGETLSAGLHSRLSFVWFVLSAARETLGAQALLRLWRVCVASAVGPGDAVSLFSALRKALPLKERQWAGSSATAKSGVVRVVVKSEAAGVVLRRLVGPAVAGPSVTPAWLPAGTSAARDDWNSQVLPAATSCLADALAFVNSREGGLELDHSSAGAARLTPFWLRALPSSLVSISALWTAAVDSEALRAAVAAAGPGGAAAEGALSAARRMLLALHSRVELSQASRVQAGRAVSPSAVWVEFVEGCLARAGQAAVAIEKLHAPVAGLMGPSESKQAAAQAAAARAVPRMEAALWLMLLFVRRLAARGALALPGKSAGGGSAKRGKGKASSSSAGGRGGIGKGLAAGKPAEPALPIGVIPSKVVDWKQPPSGGKPKTHVEVTCQVKVSLSEGRLAGRTVRHRVRLPKGSPVGDLRAHIAKDSGLCGSDRLRIRHSATNVLPRSFDELSFEDAGIGTSCSAEILPFPAEDTEGEGGFVYEGPAAVEDAADDAALDVAEASGGGAAGAAAAGSADAGAAGAGGRAGNAVPDGREEDEEEHDATSAGSTSASAPMPWLLDPFAKARAVAAAEAGAKAAAAGAAPFVSAAAAWAPLRGAGPYGAGLADPDERRAAMGLLRGQAGFTGTMLAALLAGGDAAQVAWRVLRLVPWSPQLLRAVETGSPLQLRTDQALVDRVLAGGSSAEPEHSAAPGGKGRGKGAGGRVSGAKVSSARPSSGPSWGQGSQWELLFGGREAAAVAALPALLCVERCVSEAAIAALGCPVRPAEAVPARQSLEASTASAKGSSASGSKASAKAGAAATSSSAAGGAAKAGGGQAGGPVMSSADAQMLAASAAGARPSKKAAASGAAKQAGSAAKGKPRVRLADGEGWFAAWAAGGGAAHVMSLVARTASGAAPPALLWVRSAAAAAKRASAGSGSAASERDAASGDDDDIVGPAPDAAASAGVAAAAVALRATSTLLSAEASHTEADAVARGLLSLVFRVLAVSGERRPAEPSAQAPAGAGDGAAMALDRTASGAAGPAGGLDRELCRLVPHLWHRSLFAVGGGDPAAPLLRTPNSRGFAMKLLRVVARRDPAAKDLLLALACRLYGDDGVCGDPPPLPEPWASARPPAGALEGASAMLGARTSLAAAWGRPEASASSLDTRAAELLAASGADVDRCETDRAAALAAASPMGLGSPAADAVAAAEWRNSPVPARVGAAVRGAGASASMAPGLENLGATCYLNATLQQLFAVQSFRAGVLALDVGEDADLARQARAETGGACSGEAGCDNGDHDSLLFQLQSLFAHLHEHRGGGRAGTTAALCGAFRDWEGAPINPRVQQDATEFLSSLFQQLEGRLAGTRHARIMSAPFGLGYVCTLNADVAAARAAGAVESFSARRVDNTSVSVPVVGSDARDEGLRAGLAAFVAADEVEYRWPVAGSAKGAELRSLKRQLIGSTPPHLLLSLSRFQFDMEALCQRKVNDRIAFPSLLDVFEFTPNGQRRRRRRRAAGQGDGESAAEAVADAAGALWQAGGASTLAAAREEEEDDVGEDGEGECWERLGDGAPVPGPAGCVYVLSGVVVHRGTAQAGHYWSLARDRSTRLSLRAGSAKDAAAAARRGAVGASALGLNDAVLSGHEDAWFKLDDRRVAPFPVADMELEAFGGELTSSGQKRKADQSAFILVYDRVDPAAVAEWARLTTLEVACPDVVEFAMDVATMGNPAEPTDGTPDTGLVHEWLLTAVDTAAAPGAAEAPAVTGWWSAWLESCVSPRMLPPDMMAHKRSALERGGQGPAKAGRQAAGASAGSRGGKRRGKATGGGGGGASKAGAAAAAAEAALAGAGAEVSVDAPLWVPSWALGAEAEEPVSWDDVGAIMTAVLTSSPASGPLPARALCSGAWPAARAVVASDDDCAGLVGSTVQFQRGTGVRAKQETIEGTVTHFDAGRGAPGTGGEFCVRVDGGSRTLWHRLSYSPFRAVPPPAQLAKAAAALP